jgi:hypothetical protein
VVHAASLPFAPDPSIENTHTHTPLYNISTHPLTQQRLLPDLGGKQIILVLIENEPARVHHVEDAAVPLRPECKCMCCSVCVCVCVCVCVLGCVGELNVYMYIYNIYVCVELR